MNQQTPTPSDSLLSISKIQEQLNALNRKMDIILGKLSNNGGAPKPNYSPVPVSANIPTTINPPSQKMMYKVICADCKKECSIPFKPVADRPVYCKECFALRRSGQTPRVNVPVKSSPVAVPAPVKAAKKPAVKKAAAKPAVGGSKKTAVKKTVAKKKTVTKKRK
jgi:CxxC-x17-CxxC domain-containing protein